MKTDDEEILMGKELTDLMNMVDKKKNFMNKELMGYVYGAVIVSIAVALHYLGLLYYVGIVLLTLGLGSFLYLIYYGMTCGGGCFNGMFLLPSILLSFVGYLIVF